MNPLRVLERASRMLQLLLEFKEDEHRVSPEMVNAVDQAKNPASHRAANNCNNFLQLRHWIPGS